MSRQMQIPRNITRLFWLIVLALLIVLSACAPAPAPQRFIGVNMRELPYLKVSEPTAYDLDLAVSPSDYLTARDTRGSIQQQLETASHMGVMVIRIYLSNPNVKTSDVKSYLNNLFAITAYLKQNNKINKDISYIIVLADFYRVQAFQDLDVNYYTGTYGWLKDDWFVNGYKQPFGSYPSFDDYAKDIINTYKTATSVTASFPIGGTTTWSIDPKQIYAWEMGNEFSASLSSMTAFIQDEGCKLHGADRGHRFTSGFLSADHAVGGGSRDPSGHSTAAQILYADIKCASDGQPVFDFGTIHAYNNQWDPASPDDPTGGGEKHLQLDDVDWFNNHSMPYILEELGFTGAYPGAKTGTLCPYNPDSFPLDATAETDRSTLTQTALTDFFGTYKATGVFQWAFKAGMHAGALTDGCKGMDSDPHVDWDQLFVTYCNQAKKLNPSLPINCSGPTASAIDAVIVMDTTGSMGSSISGAKQVAINYIDALANSDIDYRAAVVDYKDKLSDPYASRVDLGFTTDRTAIVNAINALYASGGGDLPEDVYSGIMTAVNLPWRNGAKKVILLMGDAGPHDPEFGTGFTLNSVIAAANAVDPVSIYAIRVGSDSYMRSIFQQLASGTGGMTFDTSYNISDVSAAILSALNAAARSPSAVIGENNGQLSGVVGTPIHFDASHSFDMDGFIVRYEWDFDNNGVFDFNSPDPAADYTYAQAYNGLVTLRVTDNDGNTGRSSARIVVSLTGNDTTPPVITITSPLAQPYLHTTALNVTWTATDTGSGVASSTGTLDGSTVTNGRSVDLFFLSLGSHTLTVNATDNAGNTASASVTFTIVADINSLIAMEQRACALGWISGDGVCNSLLVKLQAAKASIDRGQFNAAKNQLNAFMAELDAQNGKKVTQGFDLLKSDTAYVISTLP